jgi:leader peptidase (prepilin peptidase) / N-methyltransferase
MFNDLILLLENPAYALPAAALLGLVIGSFLNVVIHRLPIMMHQEWNRQCTDLLHPEQAEQNQTPPPLTLNHPRSRCPHCNHPIGAFENIPVVSFLIQKGRCKHCQQPISWRYPTIELLTALLSLIVIHHFGFGWQGGAALIISWSMIVLTLIDYDEQLLPDSITLPLLWLGLLASLIPVFVPTSESIIGAAIGYLSLWSIYWAFKLLTGKEGMGYGDFKLLALFGAWFGWQSLPLIILLSAGVGAVVGIALITFTDHTRNKPIPFGPYLAAAGWIAMLWGSEITELYLQWALAGG